MTCELMQTPFMHNTGENQGCGGTKNLTAGPVTLASVDMDRNGKYDDNLDCQWLLIAPEFRSVEITFNAFNLEGSQGLNKNADGLCPFDYIEVYLYTIISTLDIIIKLTLQCYIRFLLRRFAMDQALMANCSQNCVEPPYLPQLYHLYISYGFDLLLMDQLIYLGLLYLQEVENVSMDVDNMCYLILIILVDL